MNSVAYVHALKRLLEHPSSPRLGLDRMQRLLDAVGNPERAFKSVHIAGTNGKGSTAAMVDAMFRARGLHVGLTTSPHLVCARERIVVDGNLISEDMFVEFEARIFAATGGMRDDPPTFFERMIALAFLAFRAHDVDVAVVEVGLGGRLDATNVLQPIVTAIVSIGLDHQAWLGDTAVEIAAEKAGIAKRDVPLVVGVVDDDVAVAIAAVATRTGARLRWATDIAITVLDDGRVEIAEEGRALVAPFAPKLFGKHQLNNAAVALRIVEESGLVDDLATRQRGLETVSWPGRFERITHGGVEIVLDGAHNPDGARALAAALKEFQFGEPAPTVVVGATSGHDPETFARALHHGGLRPASVVATMARAPRSLGADVVRAGHDAVWGTGRVECRALDEVLKFLDEGKLVGPVVVTGSLYLVGEVRAHLLSLPQDPVLPLF